MLHNRWIDWARFCGILAAVLAGSALGIVDIQTSLSATLHQPLYELGMSDLVGTFNAALVNGIGHLLAGALLALAAIIRLLGTDRNSVGAAIALLLAGIFWAALGVTPARYGDEQAMVVHGFWMLGFQGTGGIALLLLARDERGEHPDRSPWLLLGAALVLASVLSGLRGLPVPGLLERIGIGTYFVCIVFQAQGLWRRQSGPITYTALR